MLAAFALMAIHAGAVAIKPESVVKSFYTWYVACTKAMDSNPPKCDYLGKDLATQRSRLTPQFYGELDEADQLQKKIEGEVIGADPFSATQMGTCSFTMGTATIAGETAFVPVTVHLCPLHGKNTVRVKLRLVSGAWRIADVIAPDSGSQAAIIAQAIKDARKQLHARTPHRV